MLTLLLSCYFSIAQKSVISLKDTLILGSEKHFPAVIKIYEKYTPIIDSLTNIRISQNSKPGTNEKYSGTDKSEGYYIALQLDDYETLIKQFLNINRVKAVFYFSSWSKKESYYEVSFEGNNKDLKDGRVRWYIKDGEK